MTELVQCAKKDYDAIHVLMKNKSTDEYFLTLVCYLYQQTVEKLLKALIELHGQKFPFTHDIDELSSICVSLGYDIPESLMMIGAMLTNWEAKTRYKSSIRVTIQQIDLAEEICQKLFKIAEGVERADTVKKINCFGEEDV